MVCGMCCFSGSLRLIGKRAPELLLRHRLRGSFAVVVFSLLSHTPLLLHRALYYREILHFPAIFGRRGEEQDPRESRKPRVRGSQIHTQAPSVKKEKRLKIPS